MTTIDLAPLQTESCNEKTSDIDVVSTVDMCRLINDQDKVVAQAVSRCLHVIAAIIDELAPRVQCGGRVIYLGAGTSGRLGILDASEIPPTFSAPYGQWIGLIAGGDEAIHRAVEGAEDDPDSGAYDLERLSPSLDRERDSIIGLAASGRTPYVLGALRYARSLGCFTAGVCCVKPSAMRDMADLVVECPVGPEVVTGSTRMKSGTAQKMILNMISTGCQVRIGKTYGNHMIDVKRSNLKLLTRARHVFRSVLIPLSSPPSNLTFRMDLSDDQAVDNLIDACDGSVKRAVVAARWNCSSEQALRLLESAGGILKQALASGPETK